MITPKQFLEEFLPVNLAAKQKQERERQANIKYECIVSINDSIAVATHLPIEIECEIHPDDVNSVIEHYCKLGWKVGAKYDRRTCDTLFILNVK